MYRLCDLTTHPLKLQRLTYLFGRSKVVENLQVYFCVFGLPLTMPWKADLRGIVLYLYSDPFMKNHKEDFIQMASELIWKLRNILAPSLQVCSSLINKDKAQVHLLWGLILSLSCISRGWRNSKQTQNLLSSQGNSLTCLTYSILKST